MIVNIEKTREYYNSLSLDTLCDCDYFKLYYAKAKQELTRLLFVKVQWTNLLKSKHCLR